MDSETKHVLISLCAVIRDSTEQAFYAHQMAEKVAVSCDHTVAGFRNCYESPVPPTKIQHIADAKERLLEQLDALIQQLST